MLLFAAGWKGTHHGHGKEGQVLKANLGLAVLAELQFNLVHVWVVPPDLAFQD